MTKNGFLLPKLVILIVAWYFEIYLYNVLSRAKGKKSKQSSSRTEYVVHIDLS